MDFLFIIQYTCLLFTIVIALMLIVARFYTKWTNPHYETSRWVLVAAILLLGVHFYLQMRFRLRAQGDDVGALFNILFFLPTAFLVTYSIVHLDCAPHIRRRFRVANTLLYSIVLIVFAIGYKLSGSLHLGNTLILLHLLNICYLITNTYVFSRIIKHKRTIIDNEIGGDIHSYVTYTHIGFFNLSVFTVIAVSLILSRTLLLIAAPFFLLSLFVFIFSFVALGFNLQPLQDLFKDPENGFDCVATDTPDDKRKDGSKETETLSTEQLEKIDAAILQWRNDKGYRNSDTTISELSRCTGITRGDLKAYLDQRHHCTFRIWLSALRFEEAKRLMIEHPEYSNEVVSTECGLSSRAQLYNVFHTNAGMTPKEWKDKVMKS